jgi:hypothetical protein
VSEEWDVPWAWLWPWLCAAVGREVVRALRESAVVVVRSAHEVAREEDRTIRDVEENMLIVSRVVVVVSDVG